MAVIDYLTAILVFVTAIYAYLTHKMAKASEASVQTMQEQSEAMFRPYVTVSPFIRPHTTVLYLRIENTGKAAAESWNGYGTVFVYILGLGFAMRFLHYSLFAGPFVSPFFYAIDVVLLMIFAAAGFQSRRTIQNAIQASGRNPGTHMISPAHAREVNGRRGDRGTGWGTAV